MFIIVLLLGCLALIFQVFILKEETNNKKLMKEMQVFESIFKSTTKPESDGNCNQEKFLVYQCYRTCGGLGDREKGIVSAYLLAMLTGRKFIIDLAYPCMIDLFLHPNKYQWKMCKHYIQSLSKSEKLSVLTIDNRLTYERIFTESDVRYSWKAKVVTITINWYALAIIRHYLNKTSVPELEWIRNTSNERVVQSVLYTLFRPTKHLENVIATFIDTMVGNRTLVCSHLRVGQNPSLPNDVDFSRFRGHVDLSEIIKFLSVFNSSNSYAIYVATDSGQVRNIFAKRFVNFISLNRTVMHIDRLSVSDAFGCVGFYNAITEQLLLTKCSVLLLTMSNFGTMAALMRNKADGLYTYLSSNNSIVKLSTWEIFEFYRFK